MSGERIGVILIRLGAVFLVARSLQSLTFIPLSLFSNGQFQWQGLIAMVPMVGVPVLVAILLWQLPSTILGKLPPAEQTDDRIDYDALMFVGVSLIGLYVLVFGLLELSLAVYSHAMLTEYGSRPGIHEQIYHRYFSGIVQTGFGIALVLGRRGITRLMSRARRAGTGVD